MGVTGAGGFPFCCKQSVDIMETQDVINHHQQAREEEMELENELPELEPPHKVDPELELDMELEAEAVPQLEPCPMPMLEPEAELDFKSGAYNEDLEQLEDNVESFHPSVEGPTQPNASPCSERSNSSYLRPSEKEHVSTTHRSIHLQTSKHLFWADKCVQTSQQSLSQEISRQPGKKSTDKTSSHLNQEPKDTPCSKKQLQNTSTLSGPGSQLPPSTQPSSYSLAPAIRLADLVKFASSVAMATSKMDLPSLKNMVKAPPQNAMEPSTVTVVESATQPAEDEPEQEKLSELPERPPEKPLEARELQKAWKQENKSFLCPYLDLSKPGLQRATLKGKVKLIQSPATCSPLQGDRKKQQRAEDQEAPAGTKNMQKPQSLLTRDPEEEQAGRTQKGRQQPTQMGPAAATATGAEQASPRATEFNSPAAPHSGPTGPGAGSQSFADKNPIPLTPQQVAAFQDIFKLFSSSPTGTVDMCSMKAVLRNVGIQLSPQEMCQALQQADLDGDGTVSFKDFLGVLTDNHCLAQCLGQMGSSQACDPQGLCTLFLEMLFKLIQQGFVPYKSAQEVMSYYSKKQQTLRLSSGCKSQGPTRSHGSTPHAQTGLTFFCQATRLSGLTYTELVRSLHRLHQAGVHSPYSQIPKLAEWTPPEHKTRNRASHSQVGLPKSYPSSHPKLWPNQRRRSQGLADQPLENMHPSKLAPSPPTLVQKQPFSPPPACLQRPAMKNFSK